MPLVEIANLSLSFAGLRALSNVSFAVETGEIIGLIGPNGAGKSTLLNCISRIYMPDHGTIRFQDRDLNSRTASEVAAEGIRRTFQNLELFREATVRENVALGLIYRYRTSLLAELFALPSARDNQRGALKEADQIVAEMGLSEWANVLVAELPYGSQKLVELARAMAGHPKLLLLDEPAAGMNREESRRVAETVRRLRDHKGITVLLIEHDMRVVMTVCDRIVVLDHGEKIAEGTPAEIRRSPAVVKAYLGDA
ncbi:MAG: ABC transporter ATP-binding protein [Pseudolabrys sp.]|nr:ABC transporter ATP-binding protein [Pseudolabrys sp.]